LKDFSDVGESVARHGHSQSLEVKFVFEVVMIDWTGSDQILGCPTQHHVVLLLFCSFVGMAASLFESFGFFMVV